MKTWVEAPEPMFKKKKTGKIIHACNLSARKAETGFPGFTGQPISPACWILGQWETLFQNKRRMGTWGCTRLSSSLYPHMHTCVGLCTSSVPPLSHVCWVPLAGGVFGKQAVSGLGPALCARMALCCSQRVKWLPQWSCPALSACLSTTACRRTLALLGIFSHLLLKVQS